MHHQYPTCTSLTVHLENEQVVYFDEGEDMIAMLDDPQKRNLVTRNLQHE